LNSALLEEIALWVAEYRRFQDESFDRLEQYVATIQSPAPRSARRASRKKAGKPNANEYESFVDREIVTTRVISAPPNSTSGLAPSGASSCTVPLVRIIKIENVFVEVTQPERLVLDHVSPPCFRVMLLFEDLGGSTKITFRQLFELPEVYRRVKVYAVPANEEKIDKLEAELARSRTGQNPRGA
jgi:hypothetical protein